MYTSAPFGEVGKRIYINHLAFHPEQGVVTLKYPRQGHPPASFAPTANVCDPKRFTEWHKQLSEPAMRALNDFTQMTPGQFRRTYPQYVVGANGIGLAGGNWLTFLLWMAAAYFIIRMAVTHGLRAAR